MMLLLSRRILEAFAVLAMLAAGYLGMLHVAPGLHAAGAALSHSQVADTCLSSNTHC